MKSLFPFGLRNAKANEQLALHLVSLREQSLAQTMLPGWKEKREKTEQLCIKAIEQGAGVHRRIDLDCGDGTTTPVAPLVMAISAASLVVVDALLNKGADPGKTGALGYWAKELRRHAEYLYKRQGARDALDHSQDFLAVGERLVKDARSFYQSSHATSRRWEVPVLMQLVVVEPERARPALQILIDAQADISCLSSWMDHDPQRAAVILECVQIKTAREQKIVLTGVTGDAGSIERVRSPRM